MFSDDLTGLSDRLLKWASVQVNEWLSALFLSAALILIYLLKKNAIFV